MTKEFYQILEINENATAEEIKKAYRKLALKWHPDKWSTKSPEERAKANEEMRKINQAYEVLGDEEKKGRYDSGETNSSTASDSESYEEFLRRKEEEIDDITKKIKLIGEFLLRRDVINEISYELVINGVYTIDLDHSLWAPYETWVDMVYEIEVGDDENDIEFIDRSKVNAFKEKND